MNTDQLHPPNETPRTDAEFNKEELFATDGRECVSADFARSLEKELSEAKDYVDEVRSSDLIRQELEANLRHDFTRLRSVAAQMAGALEKIAAYTKPTGMQGGSIVNEIATSAFTAYQALRKEKE